MLCNLIALLMALQQPYFDTVKFNTIQQKIAGTCLPSDGPDQPLNLLRKSDIWRGR